MHKFISVWQRKAGCVLLTLACILLLGWFRGIFVADIIRFRADQRSVLTIQSDTHGIEVSCEILETVSSQLSAAARSRSANYYLPVGSVDWITREPEKSTGSPLVWTGSGAGYGEDGAGSRWKCIGFNHLIPASMLGVYAAYLLLSTFRTKKTESPQRHSLDEVNQPAEWMRGLPNVVQTTLHKHG